MIAASRSQRYPFLLISLKPASRAMRPTQFVLARSRIVGYHQSQGLWTKVSVMSAHRENRFRPSCELLEDRCVLSSGAAVQPFHVAVAATESLPREVVRGRITLFVGHNGEEVLGLNVDLAPGAVEEWGLVFGDADQGLLAKAKQLVGKEVIVTSPLVMSPDLYVFEHGLEIDVDGDLIVERLQAVDPTSDASSASAPPSGSRQMLPVGSESQAPQSKGPQLASTNPSVKLLQHATIPALPVMPQDNRFAASRVGAVSTGSGDGPSVGATAATRHTDSWQPTERIAADQPRHVPHSPAVPLNPLVVDAVFSSL